jgi:hypothetical protein
MSSKEMPKKALAAAPSKSLSAQNFDKESTTKFPVHSRPIWKVENMPGRQSHGGPPSKKPRVKNNSKKRALDAFSIASHTNPDKIKIRLHRLGVQEGGKRPGKRRRDEEDEEAEEEEETSSKKQKKGPARGRFDELDIDAGE